MAYPVPILFIIFNRLDIAKQSFAQISCVKPSKLYIASDGPRNSGENEIVIRVREEIMNMVTWPCDIKTLFRTKNLGCGNAVYSAINWFFSHEPYGIVLEDDCVAERTFFDYMQELLLYYQHVERIGMIAGYNHLGQIFSTDSYCFSRYKACWGWGSWRRAWQSCMDINMSWRKSNQYNDVLANMGYRGKGIRDWKYKIKLIDQHIVSAWDWQWYFSLAANNMLTIFPAVNLISNIGNDQNATHTSLNKTVKPSYPLSLPLKHPQYILPSWKFDQKFYEKTHTVSSLIKRILPHSVKVQLKTLYTILCHK